MFFKSQIINAFIYLMIGHQKVVEICLAVLYYAYIRRVLQEQAYTLYILLQFNASVTDLINV